VLDECLSQCTSAHYGTPTPLLLRCVVLQLDGRPPVKSTASVFRDAKVADLFFKTDRCMRNDQTTCWPAGMSTSLSFNDYDHCIVQAGPEGTAVRSFATTRQSVAVWTGLDCF
jgi:hypothetical protein